MINMSFMAPVTRAVSKGILKVQKHSPALLFVAGTALGIASTVTACRSTLKIDEILDEHKEVLDKIHTGEEHPELCKKPYTKEMVQQDKTALYSKTFLKLVKLYGLPVLLGALSIACFGASFGIMQKRIVGLTAAYATLDQSFKEYRKRVIERFGEPVDYQLSHNIKAETIVETVTNENGEEEVKTEEVLYMNEPKVSGWSRMFAKGESKFWNDYGIEYNMTHIDMQQNALNDRLKSEGFVFLNDAYKALGFKPTQEGQVVGWFWDPDNKDSDHYIDFNPHVVCPPPEDAHIANPVIIVDFNIDGTILDKLSKQAEC